MEDGTAGCNRGQVLRVLVRIGENTAFLHEALSGAETDAQILEAVATHYGLSTTEATIPVALRHSVLSSRQLRKTRLELAFHNSPTVAGAPPAP